MIDSKKILMVCCAIAALSVAGLCVVLTASSISHSRAEARIQREHDEAQKRVDAARQAEYDALPAELKAKVEQPVH